MSAPDRRAMVERPGKHLSVRRQCALVGVARSGVYRPQAHRRGGRSGGDAPHRRTASRTSVLRLAANDQPSNSTRRAVGSGAAVDAGDGDRSAGSAPRHEQSRALAQDIPLPAARPEDCPRKPNHVWAADVTPTSRWRAASSIWWRSSTGPAGRFWHGGCRTPTMRASVRGGAGGGATSVRKATADFQYRSGLHFHRRGFRQQACDCRRRDFDGRTRPLHGQHFHRTAVALDQVRRSASESLRRWLRGAVRHQFLDELLQLFDALTRR